MNSQDRPKIGVIVAGMPASGNRIVRKLLDAHGMEVHIAHGGGFEEHVRAWQENGFACSVIIPLRNEVIHRMAYRDGNYNVDYDEYRAEHYFNTVELAARLKLPMLSTRYSHLVQNPGGFGKMVCGWLGIEFNGWPIEVINGDLKYVAEISGTPLTVDEEQRQVDGRAELNVSPSRETIVSPMSATLYGRSRAGTRKLLPTTRNGNES